MNDPLLMQLVAIAETFDSQSSDKPEIFITLRIGGECFSGTLISSRNFILHVGSTPTQSQIDAARSKNPDILSGQGTQNPPEFLHIIDGKKPPVFWRFKISAVEGFTLDGVPDVEN